MGCTGSSDSTLVKMPYCWKSHVAAQFYLYVSYCMVCVYVRKDNPLPLTSGLSPIHTHNHAITALLHQQACALCAL